MLEYWVSLKLVSLILQYEGLLIDLNCHVSFCPPPTMIFPKIILEYFYNGYQYKSHDIIDVHIYYDFPAYVSQITIPIAMSLCHYNNHQAMEFKGFKVGKPFLICTEEPYAAT